MQIIAEIGSNWAKTDNMCHNYEWAKKQIVWAKQAGATDVKFQFYTHEDLFGEKGKGTCELPPHMLPQLANYADLMELDFLCTAFSKAGYDLVDPLVKMHKVASCEATDLKLIDHVMGFNKPVMISTGGLKTPQIEEIIERYPWSQLILADCVIDYPANPSQYNLCILNEWRNMYATALSDHTHGYVTALAAQGLGATIFEKHVDFFPHDGKRTPDAAVSCNFDDFKAYCQVIRDQSLPKQISAPEAYNVKMYQRRETPNGFYRPLPRYTNETSTSKKD
jgi:sialic acid synthase SpsE